MVLQGSSSDDQQASMYARTYSRASISFIISALKMSAEPAYPIDKRVFALWRNDGGHFDHSWAESNGVLTHAQV